MEENVDYSKMNIYKKIQLVKYGVLNSNLKKSGVNKFSKFKYYELNDIIPAIINNCTKVGLFTKITYENDRAILQIKNIDNPEEIEEYTSPISQEKLSGCNEIQSIGGIQTYLRRYLYMSAFDIAQTDIVDQKEPVENNDVPDDEQINLKIQFDEMIIKTETDLPTVLKTYGVKDSTQLSKQQLTQAINHMAKKIKKEDNEVF